MKRIALLALLPVLAFAQAPATAPGFEEPPVLQAPQILREDYLSGPGFKVRDAIPTSRGYNLYTIETPDGVIEADGNTMLVKRVREIHAIARLRDVSRTEEYAKALANAAKSPFKAAKSLIESPTKTITGVPKGMWKMLNRAGQGIKEIGQERHRSEYEDSSAEELIGFSKSKRALALELGVDPYSSNETLQKELNGIAWASYAGKSTFQLASIPVGGGVGAALTATNATNTFNDALREKSPTDLRLANLKKLLEMGCSREVADSFLANPAFSPTAQTAFVLHLEQLNGVKGRIDLLRMADGVSTAEADAMFFVGTSRILAQLHTGKVPLTHLSLITDIPFAHARDGRAVVALEWDYAAWTEMAQQFLARVKATKFEGTAPSGILIALSGEASPLAQAKLKEAGVELVTRLAPGPLR